jgi:hypothetical protein
VSLAISVVSYYERLLQLLRASGVVMYMREKGKVMNETELTPATEKLFELFNAILSLKGESNE